MKLSDNELIGVLDKLHLRQLLSEDDYRFLAHLVNGILFGEDPGAEFRMRKARGRPSNWEAYWLVIHSEILRRRTAYAKDADLQVCSHWGIKPDTLKKYRRVHGVTAKHDVDQAAEHGKMDELLSYAIDNKREGDEKQ